MAIPLHNITWVNAFRLKRAWGVAAARLLALLIGAVLVYAALDSAGDGEPRAGENGNLVVVIVVIGLAVVCKGLFTSAKPVLAVEMASGSKVMVTLPSMDELRRTAGRIVHDRQSGSRVRRPGAAVQYSHTNNYGPVVNMRDGRGNTGFKL
ncbi:DUF6232 family protein [Streptomyces sp. M92]|nr:DUF6232 family protein [Streptomyces sp. M92]WCN05831.1 DUF6232 family protein [Streptomyces sp. M92]